MYTDKERQGKSWRIIIIVIIVKLTAESTTCVKRSTNDLGKKRQHRPSLVWHCNDCSHICILLCLRYKFCQTVLAEWSSSRVGWTNCKAAELVAAATLRITRRKSSQQLNGCTYSCSTRVCVWGNFTTNLTLASSSFPFLLLVLSVYCCCSSQIQWVNPVAALQ